MKDINGKLNDENLENVNGGAAEPRGTIDVAKGGFVLNGKDGVAVTMTQEEFNWLKSQYNDPNGQEFLKTVSGKEIQQVLAKRRGNA